jgi:hypothetical protein
MWRGEQSAKGSARVEDEFGDAGGDVEAGLGRHAHRLQRVGAVEAADQNVGSGADSGGGLGGGADIGAPSAPGSTLPGANTTQFSTWLPVTPMSMPNLLMTPE